MSDQDLVARLVARANAIYANKIMSFVASVYQAVREEGLNPRKGEGARLASLVLQQNAVETLGKRRKKKRKAEKLEEKEPGQLTLKFLP